MPDQPIPCPWCNHHHPGKCIAMPSADAHVYLSTGCLHGRHDYCQSAHVGCSDFPFEDDPDGGDPLFGELADAVLELFAEVRWGFLPYSPTPLEAGKRYRSLELRGLIEEVTDAAG